MKTPEHQAWNPTSWQTRPAQQQPSYPDQTALLEAVAQLSRLPPIVVSWEVERLREDLAAAQRGESFLLQGGDILIEKVVGQVISQYFPDCLGFCGGRIKAGAENRCRGHDFCGFAVR